MISSFNLRLVDSSRRGFIEDQNLDDQLYGNYLIDWAAPNDNSVISLDAIAFASE